MSFKQHVSKRNIGIVLASELTADSDAVVFRISDDFVLDLLPALETWNYVSLYEQLCFPGKMTYSSRLEFEVRE